MTYSFALSIKRVIPFLVLVAVLLTGLTIGGKYLENLSGNDLPRVLTILVSWVNVTGERSAATWFAVMLLLLCGGVLAVIAASKRVDGGRYRHYWLGLAIVFVGMSIEEVAGVHEQLNSPMGSLIERSGYLYYGWVIVGMGVVLLGAALCFRFWLHLDPRTRWLFFLAAVLYVGGSIGLEMISARVYDARNGYSMRYWFVSSLEELCEMLGLIVFLFALLDYQLRDCASFRVVLSVNRSVSETHLPAHGEPTGLQS